MNAQGKLTKGERTRILRNALYHAERTLKFLNDNLTEVRRPFCGEMVPINKEIGSDLCGIQFTITEIQHILTAETGQVFGNG